ncbi:MAG TPA: helix-turn-helix domain-containing protein [Longimicrobiaceae bacterium]|nr:helix-turn-helix domain-containing protein [Longimicrobiaceae bacterium]
MKRVSRPLFVLHRDPGFRERVREACGSDYQFQVVRDWDELSQVVRESPPAALAVVDPYSGTVEAYRNGGGELSASLRGLLAEFPSTAVLAALDVRPDRYDDLRTLGKWGVVQVITLDHDDTPYSIGQRLRAARGRPLRALLEAVLPPETSGRARAIMEAATDVVTLGEHGRDLASALHLSRRTLLRWCQRAGLPAPRRLLAWMRVLLACELLDDPGRSVLSVAHTCGYSSDSGLRRITQKFLGASPSNLRDRGAFRVAAAAFVEALKEERQSKWQGRDL